MLRGATRELSRRCCLAHQLVRDPSARRPRVQLKQDSRELTLLFYRPAVARYRMDRDTVFRLRKLLPSNGPLVSQRPPRRTHPRRSLRLASMAKIPQAASSEKPEAPLRPRKRSTTLFGRYQRIGDMTNIYRKAPRRKTRRRRGEKMSACQEG